MGGWIQSGNYTHKKYGAEKARTLAVKGNATKADQNIVKGVVDSLKAGSRQAARERQSNVRAKKK